jgi:hypothetical protein
MPKSYSPLSDIRSIDREPDAFEAAAHMEVDLAEDLRRAG